MKPKLACLWDGLLEFFTLAETSARYQLFLASANHLEAPWTVVLWPAQLRTRALTHATLNH
jgi:hypothetical protein